MNELESILNYLETTSLEPHDDYTSEFTYKEQKLLWNYIRQLKEQLEKERKARKEAIEFMKNCEFDKTDKYIAIGEYQEYKDLIKILDIDKGE